MRAISIRQPFVEQILRGVKRFEFRSRPTKIFERVYLYASLKAEEGGRELPRGKIVGTVEIVRCRPRPGGGYAYELRGPKRLTRSRKPANQPQPCFWRPEF